MTIMYSSDTESCFCDTRGHVRMKDKILRFIPLPTLEYNDFAMNKLVTPGNFTA